MLKIPPSFDICYFFLLLKECEKGVLALPAYLYQSVLLKPHYSATAMNYLAAASKLIGKVWSYERERCKSDSNLEN